MTTHPIESVGGLTTTGNVPKADLVGYEKLYVPLRLASVAALQAIDLTGSWLVFVDGNPYTRDSADTTTPDDGAWTIRDSAGNAWKKTPQLGSFDVYAATATRATYNAEAAGFTFFSLDEYGFYVRIGAAGNWSSLVPFRGQRGGDRYEIFNFDSQRPGVGEELLLIYFTTLVTFPAGLTGSVSFAEVASTATAIYSIKKNGVQVGTITYAAGVLTPTIAMASQTTFTAGDRLSLVAPSPQDVTLAGVSTTLLGTR